MIMLSHMLFVWLVKNSVPEGTLLVMHSYSTPTRYHSPRRFHLLL